MNDSIVNVVRLTDIPPQPWKNGGGVTRELLTWPNPQNWMLRVSVADIERDGPFSAFPGVTRYFAVLRGEGVRLDGIGEVRVGDEAVRFEGEDAPYCKLINGSTRDLNVMIRRHAGHGSLISLDQPDDIVIAPDVKLHGIYCEQSETLAWTVGQKGISLQTLIDEGIERAKFRHFSFFADA